MAEHEHGYAPSPLTIEDYSEEQIGFHVYLMAEARLLQGVDVTSTGDPAPNWLPLYLRWEGYEFLSSVRDDAVWTKTKDTVYSKTGSLGFELLKQVAIQYIKSHIPDIMPGS
jgi:hypothetical protein